MVPWPFSVFLISTFVSDLILSASCLTLWPFNHPLPHGLLILPWASLWWFFIFFSLSPALSLPVPSNLTENKVQSSYWGLQGSTAPAISFFKGLNSLLGLSPYSFPLCWVFQHWPLCCSSCTASILFSLPGMFFPRVTLFFPFLLHSGLYKMLPPWRKFPDQFT